MSSNKPLASDVHSEADVKIFSSRSPLFKFKKFLFFKKIIVCLFFFGEGYICFTMLCQFLLYSEMKWSSLCYTAGSHLLSILYIFLYICQPQSPNSSHLSFPLLVSLCLFSTSVSLFLPCKLVHLYHSSRFHIYALIYDICFSLSDLLHSV